jgi:hypothetical protein
VLWYEQELEAVAEIAHMMRQIPPAPDSKVLKEI